MQLEGLNTFKEKKSVTLSRIEPAIFWHVALRLNQLRYRVPHKITKLIKI
jgi:hypothetical protein